MKDDFSEYSLKLNNIFDAWCAVPKTFWRQNRLAAWLLDSPFASPYAKTFHSCRVGYPEFLALDASDLKSLGVHSRLDMLRIFDIQKRMSKIATTKQRLTRSNSAPIWTLESVLNWLDTLPFGWRFINRFEVLQIDGKRLVRLTDRSLELYVGIRSRGLRHRYLLAINSLSKTGNWNHLEKLEYDTEAGLSGESLGFFSPSYVVSKYFRDTSNPTDPDSIDLSQALYPFSSRQISLAMFSYKNQFSSKRKKNTLESKDVVEWLEMLGFKAEVVKRFKESKVDGAELFELLEEDFRDEFQLRTRERIRLMCEIEFLKTKMENLFGIGNLTSVYNDRYKRITIADKIEKIRVRAIYSEKLKQKNIDIFEKLHSSFAFLVRDTLSNTDPKSNPKSPQNQNQKTRKKFCESTEEAPQTKVTQKSIIFAPGKGHTIDDSNSPKHDPKSTDADLENTIKRLKLDGAEPADPTVETRAGRPGPREQDPSEQDGTSRVGDAQMSTILDQTNTGKGGETLESARILPKPQNFDNSAQKIPQIDNNQFKNYQNYVNFQAKTRYLIPRASFASKLVFMWTPLEVESWAAKDEVAREYPEVFENLTGRKLLLENIQSLKKAHGLTLAEAKEVVGAIDQLRPKHSVPEKGERVVFGKAVQSKAKEKRRGSRKSYGGRQNTRPFAQTSLRPFANIPVNSYANFGNGDRVSVGRIQAFPAAISPDSFQRSRTKSFLFGPSLKHKIGAMANLPPPPKDPKPPFEVSLWTEKHVMCYLKNVKPLKPHLEKMKSMDGKKLLRCTKKDLNDLGVQNPKVIEALESVKKKLCFRNLENFMLEDWTAENVKVWFENATSLHKYGKVFCEKEINGRILKSMTNEVLDWEFGIPLKDRETMLKEISILKNKAKKNGTERKYEAFRNNKSFDNLPVKDWQEKDVISWILSVPCGETYVENFAHAKVSGARLVQMSNGELREDLSVPISVHRNEIILSLNKFREEKDIKMAEKKAKNSFSESGYENEGVALSLAYGPDNSFKGQKTFGDDEDILVGEIEVSDDGVEIEQGRGVLRGGKLNSSEEKVDLRFQRRVLQHDRKNEMAKSKTETQEKKGKEMLIECSFCKKKFGDTESLVVHLAVHEKKCIFCSKTFTSSDKLDQHVKEKHLKNFNYQSRNRSKKYENNEKMEETKEDANFESDFF